MDKDTEDRQIILEKMSDFFTARIDGYEEHMLTGEGGKEVYENIAELIPAGTATMLDLGCGTGLELDEIFKQLPSVSVVGIDLTRAMLDMLKQKHPDKNMELIWGSYFDIDLGENNFDSAISVATLHHFSHEEKIGLYRKIHRALKSNGIYIESDYMLTEQSNEDELYAENARLRCAQNIPEGDFYHFDTPCTVDNQIAMLKRAGFSSVDLVSHAGNGAIILARK